MTVAWSTGRRTGIDRGCGHGRQYAGKAAAEKALGRKPAAEQSRLKLRECPNDDRPDVWHLVAVAGPSVPPRVRAAVLERDGYRCVRCGTDIRRIRYSLGHRKRASQGGEAKPSNLVTFCGWGGEMCHGDVDLYRDPADGAKGYRLRSGQDPLAEPVMLFSEHGGGVTVWLTDEGTYAYEAPARAA